jgi:putative CocE/NonD family hydrolase
MAAVRAAMVAVRAAMVAVRAAMVVFVLFFAESQVWADAPVLEFHPPPTATDAATPGIMRDLAVRILPIYQESDPDRYLANLSALQMVAGDYAAADVSRQSLRDRRRRMESGRPISRGAVYDIYAYAKALEIETHVTFAAGFTRSFREVLARQSDQDAYLVTRWLETSPETAREALQKAFDQQRTNDIIGQAEAMELLWKYLAFDAYQSFAPLVDALVAEDDGRRYTAAEEVNIKTADGAGIAALVMRPQGSVKPLATLLEFTIYDSQNYAKECAAHGYAGVVAYVRGKHGGKQGAVPYEQDGNDARAVIAWIATQPWSDGRVGMYGNGYSGFTPWAAAKRPPPALKAIATSMPNAPGIDLPMGGSVFQNAAYRWSLYVTDNKPDEAEYNDDTVWRALDQKWYRSGRPYRDMGRLQGRPNPIFIRWLNHPSYDRYWQNMLPYREEFARINIPVLTISGYYAGSEPAALYYFTQHHKYNPHADHTLLIGPYDDGVMQRGALAMLQGYAVDSAALIDLRELRYQWFDHVFKEGALPDLLNQRVNYEVMAANEWRHAASLEAMAKGPMRFYLDGSGAGDRHRLTQHKVSHPTILRQTVSLSDRKDFAWTAPADFISRNLATHNAVMFVSEPLTKTAEFNGLFSGRLNFTVNKMDMDLNLTLYERLPGGDYIYLFNPTYEFRASYVRDRANRHLLKAGERQELIFKSERMTSRQLQAGSRLVMILGINKRPDREINYGTGNDVSEESVADGKIPLKIQWYSDSYIEIPIRK